MKANIKEHLRLVRFTHMLTFYSTLIFCIVQRHQHIF